MYVNGHFQKRNTYSIKGTIRYMAVHVSSVEMGNINSKSKTIENGIIVRYP